MSNLEPHEFEASKRANLYPRGYHRCLRAGCDRRRDGHDEPHEKRGCRECKQLVEHRVSCSFWSPICARVLDSERTPSGTEAEQQPWIHGHEFRPFADNATMCDRCGNRKTAHSRVPASPAPPAPEAEGGVPERVWLERKEIYGVNVWIESTSDGIEFMPRAAHEREAKRLAKDAGEFAEKCYVEQSRLAAEVKTLREALRGLATRNNPKDARSYCWCATWDWTKHTDTCAAARTALGDTK